MADLFQLTSIVATAIRECRHEALPQQGTPQQQDPGNTEETNRIAKAILMALSDAGYEISPKQSS